MISHTLPSWLRVFGDKLSDILLVIDPIPPSGRIARQHGASYDAGDIYSAVERLKLIDPRVRSVVLDYSRANATSQKWFLIPSILRCQGGTPIFAFVQAVEESWGDIVLRTDADMLFFDDGWVDEAIDLLQSQTVDLVEPPKLGMTIHPYLDISTRCFILNRSSFISRCLPLRPYQLDWARRIHRALNGRPPWLSLEEIFKREKDRGRIKHVLLDSQLGFSLHVYSREYAHLTDFGQIVSMIESGSVPAEQVSQGWNLVLEAWPIHSPTSKPSEVRS